VGGAAVGRTPDGLVVFVAGGAPDERVRVKITEKNKNFARADIVDIIASSSSRVEPPCPIFGRCGGCQWQHISYPSQLEQKQKMVRSLISKMNPGLNPDVFKPIMASPSPWNYRNRIQLHIENGLAGFFETSSHRHVAASECLISDKELNRQISEINSKKLPDQRLEIFVNPENLEGRPFAQVNTAVNSLIQHHINKIIVEHFGSLAQENQMLWDLYSGDGNFSAFVLQNSSIFKEGHAVEFNADSLRSGQTFAAKAKLPLRFHLGKVEDHINRLPQASAVIADPPRAGLSAEVVSRLISSANSLLIYISCDPATLGRDLKKLSLTFDIKNIQTFDMFPQTFHVESVVAMVRR
jgi:23S rRNA (uracil1939-C5)-methyltransferase